MSKKEKTKITRDMVPSDFTLALATVDLIPVILFAAAACVLGLVTGGPIYIIGLILTVLAGFLKVVWKYIVVLEGKNIWPLFVQMRIVMPIGFVLMLVGIIPGLGKPEFQEFTNMAVQFPVALFFVAGAVCMLVMMVLAYTLDSSKVSDNWIEQLVNCCGQFLIFLGILFSFSLSNYYHSAETVDEYAINYRDTMTVSENDKYILLKSETAVAKDLLIFYPGAKVEASAYIPVFSGVCEQGIDCIILKVPCNMAFFGAGRAEAVYKEYSSLYDHFYLGGHSMGAVVAARNIDKYSDQFEGLILLGGYSTADLSDNDISAMSLVGERDGVINRDNLEKYRGNLPEGASVITLTGGNHGQFGDYGFQEGDSEATVSKENQWQWTSYKIAAFIKTGLVF